MLTKAAVPLQRGVLRRRLGEGKGKGWVKEWDREKDETKVSSPPRIRKPNAVITTVRLVQHFLFHIKKKKQKRKTQKYGFVLSITLTIFLGS